MSLYTATAIGNLEVYVQNDKYLDIILYTTLQLCILYCNGRDVVVSPLSLSFPQ